MASLPQTALIVQHPNAPVTFDPPPSDPREQPVREADPETWKSILAAWLYSNGQREKAGIPPHPRPLFKAPLLHKPVTAHDDERGEELDRVASIDVLSDMVDRYGVSTVSRWLRYAANLRGQEIS